MNSAINAAATRTTTPAQATLITSSPKSIHTHMTPASLPTTTTELACMTSQDHLEHLSTELPPLNFAADLGQIKTWTGLDIRPVPNRPDLLVFQRDQLGFLADCLKYKVAAHSAKRKVAMAAVREVVAANSAYYSSLVTTKQAAETLGVTPGRLRAAAKSWGLVPVGSDGKSALYDPKHVQLIQIRRGNRQPAQLAA